MGDILQALHQKTNTIAMAELLPSYRLLLADSANSIADPHIWFDVQLWQEAARLLLDTISRSHPTNSRAMTYLDSLQILHTSLLSTFDSLPPNKRILVTAHDAFGYFGRAYGFQVRGLQGISTLSDFGVKDVTTLADFVVKAKVPALFVENSIPPRTIQSVLEACRRSGHPVELGGELYSDALGASDGSAGTYMGMIRQNANTIFRALEPKLP
jgi:manganese/zinc/iron transport system substrate-binding protein